MTEVAEDAREAACRRRGRARQYITAFIANLSAFSIGTMLGWTSPMQPLLMSDAPPVGSQPLSAEFVSWLGSVNFLGAVIGTLFWGVCADRLGRRRTALLVAFPFLASWALVLVAQDGWWLLLARVVVGVGCSGVIINTPIYVAEMAEDAIRGSLGSFLMIFLTAGCVFSYTVGSLTSYHGLAVACFCVPVLFLATFPFLPESPVYLHARGKRKEAEDALLWFRGGDALKAAREIGNMRERPGNSISLVTFRDLCSSRGIRKAMVISVGLVVGQQFCGILAILTYTVKIFQESGSSLSAHNSMIFVGLLQLCSSFLSSLLVDRAGRRVLLVTSYCAMALSLTLLGSYLYYQLDSWDPVFKWIPVVCLSVNVVAYSVGVGPVPFVVMSEIFPPNIRGFATSKIQLLGTSLSFVTVKTFPFLTRELGSHGCFLFYAFWSAVLTVFTYINLPETKGKPLQAILKQLNGEESDQRFNESEFTEIFLEKNKTTIVKNQATAKS